MTVPPGPTLVTPRLILRPPIAADLDGWAALASDPETVNTDAYGGGWLMRVRPAAGAPATDLLSAAEYEKLQQEEGD